ATVVPEARRGEMLGIAIGAAVGGALFGPVVGAVADEIGTGPAFSAAAVGGVILMVSAFLVPAPARTEPQGLRAAWPAFRDPRVAVGMWLTLLAGLAFGVVDVLSPLRLSRLGDSALLIGAPFLASAALEGSLAPLAGRRAGRRGGQRGGPAPRPQPGPGLRPGHPGLGARAGGRRRRERRDRPGDVRH